VFVGLLVCLCDGLLARGGDRKRTCVWLGALLLAAATCCWRRAARLQEQLQEHRRRVEAALPPQLMTVQGYRV
jgi:hypothetical protein